MLFLVNTFFSSRPCNMLLNSSGFKLVVIMFVVDLLPSTGSHTQILNDLQMQVNSSNLTHSLQKGSSSNKEESKDMHETFISTEKTAVTENIILLSETQSDISIETINPTVTTSILTYITKSSQLGNASSLSPQSDSSTLKPSYPPLSTSFLVPPSNHSANTSNKCNNETDLFLKRVNYFNTTTQKVLELFGSHYEDFNNFVNNTVDVEKAYLNHTEECQTSLEISQKNFKIIENSIIYLRNCNLNKSFTYITNILKQDLLKLEKMCWVYNETKNALLSFSSLHQNILLETLTLVNKSMNVVDVYTTRGDIKHYDELLGLILKYDNKIRNINYFVHENKLNYLMNESVMLNYVGNYMNSIRKPLSSMRKQIIEDKIGDDRNILYTIRLPFYLLTLVIGLIGNGVLLVIFALESDVRNSANILVFNIVVSDTLNLVTNILPHLILELNVSQIEPFINYGHTFCKVLMTSNFLSIGLSAWTVAILGIQKYSIVKYSRRVGGKACCISSNYLNFAYVATVWVIAISLCISTSLEAKLFVSGLCGYDRDHVLYRLLSYGVVPLIIVAVFYILSAREMALSARRIPGESQGVHVQQKARFKGAKILVALTVCFSISYIPFFLISCLSRWKVITLNATVQYIGAFLFFLLFMNSAMNPIALYVSSTTYRKYFKKYLFGCCSKRMVKSKDISLNAITNSTEIS